MSDKIERQIAAADCETDPFKIGRTEINPFSWGIYDGAAYIDFWGDDATEKFIAYLADESTPPLKIYAHNGGKFDWLFLKEHFGADLLFIGSRIVKATICDGKHELYDSYANMPVPLSSFVTSVGEKIKFDYSKLERHCRERYRKEILEYQKQDVIVLFEAITAWLEMFGNKALTMASAATNQLKASIKLAGDYEIEKLSEKSDEHWRQFYFGGRVECFEAGILKPYAGKIWKVFDINSAYPAAMKNLKHPISSSTTCTRKITEDTDFAEILAESKGALPIRNEAGGIHFPHGTFRFFATGHEIRAALELGLLKIKTVFKAWVFTVRISFEEFIDRFYNLRLAAKENLNAMLTLFYKLVMNSSYGKTAIDPRKFCDNIFLHKETLPDEYTAEQEIYEKASDDMKEILFPKMWRPKEIIGDMILWERGIETKGRFLNVACGASITGGARANMLRGLAHATRPVYCDTDSIVCEDFSGDIDPKRLGAWDLEKTGDTFALAGKKMYALFKNGACVKQASKGVALTPAEIVAVAKGFEIVYHAEAPVISLSGISPLSRTIRRTAKIEPRDVA